MKKLSIFFRILTVASLFIFQAVPARAATGDMGTGIPSIGLYTNATGAAVVVRSLSNATVPFPQGCSNLYLIPTTMGEQHYKIAIAVILTAMALNKAVRFYAHAERDGGCGVDYLQIGD